MRTDDLQPVEAAGLLSKLAKQLFGSLGDILKWATEYEEENGVIKQVTPITIIDKDSGKEGTLKIKLSPIKGRDDMYYVEAECDLPGFKLDSINGHAMRLNPRNRDAFSDLVDKVIADNGYAEGMQSKSQDEGKNTDEKDDAQADEANETVEIAEEALKSIDITAEDVDQNQLLIQTTFKIDEDDPSLLNIKFTVVDDSGNIINNYLSESYEIDALNKQGKARKWSDFLKDFKEILHEYAEENELTVTTSMLASTHIGNATYVKSSTNGKAELSALLAVDNVTGLMDAAYEIGQSEGLQELLEQGPVSVSIYDIGDTYEIEQVESISPEDVYTTLFQAMSRYYQTIVAYKWAVRDATWYDYSFTISLLTDLTEIQDTTAKWVVNHCKDFPIPQQCPCDPLLTEVTTDGNIDINLVHKSMQDITSQVLAYLDAYYINLDEVEQRCVDTWISRLEADLSYS